MMRKKNPSSVKFAICIHADDNDCLTPRMIYEILPDKMADKGDLIRVIDDEAEDYLYPAENFILIDFPPDVKKALLGAVK